MLLTRYTHLFDMPVSDVTADSEKLSLQKRALALARTCVDDPDVLYDVLDDPGKQPQFVCSLPHDAARLFVSHCADLQKRYYYAYELLSERAAVPSLHTSFF